MNIASLSLVRSLFDVKHTLQLKHLLGVLFLRVDIDRKKNKEQRALEKKKEKERKGLVALQVG